MYDESVSVTTGSSVPMILALIIYTNEPTSMLHVPLVRYISKLDKYPIRKLEYSMVLSTCN